MYVLFCSLVVAAVASSTPPAANFVRQSDFAADLLIKPQIGHHVMRVHAQFVGAAGENAFARVRTLRRIDGRWQTIAEEHEVPLRVDEERWQFSFRVPRFDAEEVTVAIELGVKRRDSLHGDELLNWHVFTLRPLGGDRFAFGESDLPPPISRLAVVKEGEFRPVDRPAPRETQLKKILVRQFEGKPIDGPRAAIRILER